MNRDAWVFYLQYYKGLRGRFLFTIFLSIGLSFLVLPIAWLLKDIIDNIIPEEDIKGLILAGLAILVLQVLTSSLTLYVRHATLEITKTIIKALREQLVQHLYRLPFEFYDKEERSRLHTVIVQDSERVDVMSNALVSSFFPAVAATIVLSLVLLISNWALFLVLVSVGPILFFLNRSLGKKAKRHVFKFQRTFERFSGGIWFLLHLMELTRIQAAEPFERAKQDVNIEELRTTSGRMAWLSTAIRQIQDGIISFFTMLIIVIGGGAVIFGWMTLGEVLAFYVIVGLMRKHLQSITYSLPNIIEGNESLNSLYDLFVIQDRRPYQGTNQIEFQGSISLENVQFSYEQQPVLNDISFQLPGNGVYAIVGPNGAGKSSIISLILGLYAPKHGRILADEIPYQELDIPHLRRFMGVVLQDPAIFPGSILDNITYGMPQATLPAVIEAAKMATAHAFISRLPEGYHTQVGDEGDRISGGERQRIAIARALLRQPTLLILDEPANHLDEAAMSQLMANLKTWGRNRVILIVSHNETIIKEAQVVFRLENGLISKSIRQQAALVSKIRQEEPS